MRLEAVIGANVARLRAQHKIGQPEFGKRIGSFLGERAWSRQTISAMENGGRSFAARDLVVLAHLLEVPVSALLQIGSEVDEVDVGAYTFGRDELEASGWQSDPTTQGLAEVLAALGNVSSRLSDLIDDAAELHQDAGVLTAAVSRVRLLQSLESKGATIEEDYS